MILRGGLCLVVILALISTLFLAGCGDDENFYGDYKERCLDLCDMKNRCYDDEFDAEMKDACEKNCENSVFYDVRMIDCMLRAFNIECSTDAEEFCNTSDPEEFETRDL